MKSLRSFVGIVPRKSKTKTLPEILSSFTTAIVELNQLADSHEARIAANGAEVKRIIDETADLKCERSQAEHVADKLRALVSPSAS